MSSQKIKNSLLLAVTGRLQLAITFLGTIMGLGILIVGFQLFSDLNGLLKSQKDLMNGDFLVVHKKIGLLNTLSGKPGTFSQEEIQELEKVKGIKSVGTFLVGKFKTSLEINAGPAAAMGGLKTELFLEAVSNEFLDIQNTDWSWKPGEQEVPLVIPEDYLQLYNLGFAGAQGLPLIPQNLLKSVRFQLTLKGKDKNLAYTGKIAGFSKRIHSILVPRNFLEFNNQALAPGRTQEPARIVIWAKDPAAPEIESFLSKQGWEWNQDKLKSGKLQSLLFSLVLVIGGFGLAVVFLSLTGLIQYLQLLSFRSAYEVQTLYLLGFRRKDIEKPYHLFAAKLLGSALIITLLFLILAQNAWSNWLSERGFALENATLWQAIGLAMVLVCAMFGINAWAVNKQIKQLTQAA